jgi:septal ring factor EnvC (AmiA/AmiB activator)
MSTQPDYFIQRHDERLTKLEDAVSDLKADVAVLQSQMTEGFEMLATKLDAINDVNQRLAVIETKQAASGRGLKFLSSLVTVAFAAILAFLGLR